jgi:hypothetical protein
MGIGKGKTGIKARGYDMSRTIVFLIILTAAVAGACSGTTDTAKNSNSGAATNSNGANRAAAPGAQSNSATLPSNAPGVNTSGQKRLVNEPAPPDHPPSQFAEAPEDSTLTSTMNPKGQVLEIRVFRDHPQLAKVEATWITPQQKAVKFFLRNGRTSEVTTDKLRDLKTATAAELLAMAGVGTGRPAAPDKGKTGAKRPE